MMALKKNVILRRPQSGRLEGRRVAVQPCGSEESAISRRDMDYRKSAEQQVAGARRQAHDEPVEFFGDDDLAAEARRCGQAESKVEHILFFFARLPQEVVPLGVDDDMTGRAGERPLAGALDIDAVFECYVDHRE